MKNVVVVGGGVIGLTSAYYLKKMGANVTVLEKDEFGMACSKGNQGWLCPALHEPVPAPGLISDSFKMIFNRDSPLYLKMSAIPKLSKWLMKFMRYCNEDSFKKGEEALLTLSQSTLSLFNSLKTEGVEFELHKQGMLFAFLDEDKLQNKLQRFKSISKEYNHAWPSYINKEEILEMEPALSNEVIGGIYLDNQYHTRPETLSKGLVKKLTEMGANMYSNSKVMDLEVENKKITAVKTEEKIYDVDDVVIATGTWSKEVAKKLNYELPLTAGKGYSITVSNPSPNVKHPLYLGDSKGGVTPFNNAIRMGGTMELSGNNLYINQDRIENIRSSTEKYFKNTFKGTEEEWVGMRPMTPDGLPVIGKVPDLCNAYIATGHAMVGVSMSPATGKIISELIHTGNTKFEIAAFNPNRFT